MRRFKHMPCLYAVVALAVLFPVTAQASPPPDPGNGDWAACPVQLRQTETPYADESSRPGQTIVAFSRTGGLTARHPAAPPPDGGAEPGGDGALPETASGEGFGFCPDSCATARWMRAADGMK